MKIRKEAPLIKNGKTGREILSRERVLPGLMIFLLLVTATWGQTVYVDRWYRGDLPSNGTLARPYRKLRVAHDLAPSSVRIQMETAVYPEQMTLSKPLTFVANGGPVTIGVSAPVVLTQHNDNNRTGFIHEVQLNTSNVNPQRFGKLFVRPVNGQIYAQPLYLSNVTMPDRRIRNVVYVATMHNTVYAFDADDPAASSPLWVRNDLGASVSIRDPDLDLRRGYRDITFEGARREQGEIGIIGTPVISLDQNALYVVTLTKQGSDIIHRLYALDLTTGATKFGGPRVIISGSILGPTFTSKIQNQRGALLLANDKVYIPFAAYGDNGPYHGWILAYNTATLAQAGSYVTPTDHIGAGIWQSGQGPAADDSGNIYFMTGNGKPDGSPLDNSFVKLRGNNLTLADWFTPCNNADLDDHDLDLGTGGPLLIPNISLMTGGGKQGKIYVLNRNNMGQFRGQPCGPGGDQGDGQIVQRFYVGDHYHHIHSLAYWNGPSGPYVYVWAEGEQLKAFRLVGERFQITPAWQTPPSTEPPPHPGAMLSISANGSIPGTGIVWASRPYRDSANTEVVPGILRAYDASDLTRELWNSKLNPGRDDFGYFAKFSFPTIANGKVYLPTFSNYLAVYGLLPELIHN